MRINIVIDDNLLSEARALSGARTARKTVELGLRALILLKKQERIRRFRGKLQWEGDLGAMRRDQ